MSVKNDPETNYMVETGETIETVIEHGINGKISHKKADSSGYRHRILHTVCICISIFTLGWRNALIGPTLPDLRIIIDENLATTSWIFTAKSFGGLLGAICGGFAYDRFNKIGVFVITVLAMGFSSALTPWCYHLAAMLVVHGFHGFCAAALETAATADMAIVWRQKAGPYMQAVQFAFSAGAIVSPLVAEPFLAEIITPVVHLKSLATNLSTVAPLYMIRTNNLTTVTERFTTNREIRTNMSVTEYGETRIYLPYSMTSFLCFLSASLYLLIFCFYGSVYTTSMSETFKCEIIEPGKRYFLTRKMKYIFTMLLASAMLLYVVSEHSFIGFLMTFLISEQKWSKERGSIASSVFWIAFAVGRLSGIAVIKYVKMSAMIIIFSSIYTSGAVLFLLAVIFDHTILIWVSVGVIGYGMSVLFSLVFSWLSKNVRTLTGKMTSIFFIFMCVGNMGVPMLIGYLMDKISQMWFIYSNIFLSCAMFANFIFALASFNLMKRIHYRSEKTNVMLKVKEND